MPPDDGWKEYQIHVLAELKRLNTCYNGLDEKVNKLCKDIATLKVKSGVWGIIGGGIPIVILLGIWLLKGV